MIELSDHPRLGDAARSSIVSSDVMEFEEAMEHVVQAFEVVGVAILAIGSVIAVVGAAVTATRRSRLQALMRLADQHGISRTTRTPSRRTGRRSPNRASTAIAVATT